MQYLWHLCLHEPQILTSKPVTQRFVSISVTGLFVRLMERGVRKGFSDKERNVAGREYALSKTGPTPTSGRTDTNFMASGTDPALGTCQVRRKLADEYATCARLFAEAVVQVTWATVDIERRRASTRRALERVEGARIAFEKHVASHGC